MRETKKSRNKVMLITGCASGIARHLTTVLAGRGYDILATDINPQALEKSAKKSKWDRRHVILKKLDLRKAGEWRAAMSLIIKKWGKLTYA